MKRPSSHHALVLLLMLFSFGMSLYISRSVFERLPHLEDELAYLYQARIFARGQVVVESPQPSNAFWQPFLLDRSGNRFSKYPPMWSAQLAVGEAMGAAWWVNAALAALAVALVYKLGAALYNRDVGVLAALLLGLSPMTLLLNGTLMGHTSALVFTLLFLYACWRVERGGALRWGIVAGAALGMVIANRPLAAVGVALPVAAWWVGKIMRALYGRAVARPYTPSLKPIALLILTALILTATLPLYNWITTGSPTTNLYTLVWSYDRLGFGECCGRSGHTLAKAFNHLRYDLSLAAADVHGWQIGNFSNTVIQHLRSESTYYPNLGLSWLIILPALVAAFGRRIWRVAAWLLVGMAWVIVALNVAPQAFESPQAAWLWVGMALAWALMPLVWLGWRGDAKHGWSYLLLALVLSTLIIHMTYWIGSQRYSARYYYEALGAWALLGALPLAWAARRIGRVWVYAAVLALMLFSLFNYSLPRIRILYGFNNVSQRWIDAARARSEGEQPLLVIVTGTELSWRSMGTFMAATSPYLDSDIIAIYNRIASAEDSGLRETMIAQFPDREVIELRGQGAEVQFVDNE
jgi:4-amino-4-deoxy-L-arabinose transferase-like glycosyltransferase